MDYTAFLTPTLGATGLLALVVLMILRGSLVSRRVHDDLRNDKDKQIEIWKTAYDTSMSIQAVQREQISALLEATRTTTHVIQALPQAAGLNERSARRDLAEAEE
jgi:hypothetical protein